MIAVTQTRAITSSTVMKGEEGGMEWVIGAVRVLTVTLEME